MPHHGHEQRKAGDLAKEQSLINTNIENILKETGLGAKDLEKKHFANFPTLEESIKEKQRERNKIYLKKEEGKTIKK